MPKNKNEIGELVQILINSTCNYVAPRIVNEENRFAYIKAMCRCLSVCNSEEGEGDLTKIKINLLKVVHDSIKNPQAGWKLFSSTDKYYKMGIAQSLDIVESISRRFDGEHPYPDEFLVRSILEDYHHEIKE